MSNNEAATSGKRRPPIPKPVRDSVLREFNHKCAICGEVRPQVHHIDHNRQNNDPVNLIPLCPNHHLIDEHNPTEPRDTQLLALFRRYKDPMILRPQFLPLWNRALFLFDAPGSGHDLTYSELTDAEDTLIRFISHFDMGGFYADEIRIGLEKHKRQYFFEVADPWQGITPEEALRLETARKEAADRIRSLHESSREQILKLVVEMLRYQNWNKAAL